MLEGQVRAGSVGPFLAPAWPCQWCRILVGDLALGQVFLLALQFYQEPG